jgi:hypothetical protein
MRKILWENHSGLLRQGLNRNDKGLIKEVVAMEVRVQGEAGDSFWRSKSMKIMSMEH